MNTDYLGKLFKNECGIKFSNYLLAIRMKKAKLLIRSTDASISSVAEQVGFPDNHTYFSQLFKKYTGVQPKDYKNSLQKK
ncbi:MAG: helix-turn-helix domain-containing protein [Clostridium sp.]|uniref:helix-turn-helix domain-containing protein n=1 Tax=Clostridium sp. TaxID=1506 RepID=UPI003D6D7D83